MKKSEVEDITSLIRRRAGLPKLEPAKERQPIAGKSSVSTKKEIPASTGGGIASPLTETPATRTLHATNALQSSDGLFVWEYQHIDKLTFTDADTVTVEVNLEDV
jgi:hypothetical protein